MKLTITVSWQSGKYTDYKKQFNNERHYENWVDLIIRKGGKIIGTYGYRKMLNIDHHELTLTISYCWLVALSSHFRAF